MVVLVLRRSAALGVLLLSSAGCSFVEPEAGAPQATCGITTSGSSARGSGYYGVGASHASDTPTCAASTGSACDACENTHCCAARSACYGDPVCACADLSLDECLEAAESSADAPGDVARCWSDFSAKGTVEAERVACERAWCQRECSVP